MNWIRWLNLVPTQTKLGLGNVQWSRLKDKRYKPFWINHILMISEHIRERFGQVICEHELYAK